MPNIPLAAVLDNDSYNNENSVLRAEHENLRIEYILAEDPKSIFKMKRILKNNGVIIICIDGNTGSGKDSNDYTAKLLNSVVNVRSGSFRLLSMTKKPFFPVLANGDILQIYDKCYVEKSNIGVSIEYLYRTFNNLLKENPYLWRFWYIYHKQVHLWNDPPPINEGDIIPREMWFTFLEKSGEKVGLEVSTGRVYKMDS